MKAPCPKCREEGRDRTGDNMTIYSDGHGYCHHPECKKYYTAEALSGEPMSEAKTFNKTSTLTVDQIDTYPVGADPLRGLLPETIAAFKPRLSFNEETGKLDKIFYPYGDTTYKIRSFPKGKGCFSWAGEAKGKGLYGKSICKGVGHLFITEGEEDAMAVHTMLRTGAPQDLDVVSLPNGAALDKATLEEHSFFSSYRRIYICMDDDTPGNLAANKIADWLCPTSEIRIVSHGELKDPSGWLQAGKALEWKRMATRAPVYAPEGIVNGVDIPLASLLEPLEEGYRVPFEGLQSRIHGLRKGEIITFCAGSGIGKSTLVRELTLSLIEQGLSTANVALEDQMNVTAQALIALDMNVPLQTFRFHPPTIEEVQPHYDKVVANGNTYFYKHHAGIDADSLMDTLYYYARSRACDFIILDHLSMVISSTKTTNERKEIDTLMTKLAKMVVETGVGLIQIVHLKRSTGDKSYAKGGEVELTDLRGSAALEQLSWCVVGMERDQQGDDRDFSRVRVLKNRTFGFTGLADNVKYYPETGRMKSVTLSDIPDLTTEELT